jgi:hypothetical protein
MKTPIAIPVATLEALAVRAETAQPLLPLLDVVGVLLAPPPAPPLAGVFGLLAAPPTPALPCMGSLPAARICKSAQW